MLPARPVCRTSLDPCPSPEMVPRLRFERSSSVLQTDVLTTITIEANWSGHGKSNPGLDPGKVLLCH